MVEKYKEYDIVRLDAEKLIHIQTLNKVVWGNVPDWESLYLKYYHQEKKYAFLGYLAFDIAGEVVGYHGVSVLSVMYQNQTKIIAHNQDAMLHPAHRKKGLYFYLINKAHQLCKEKGIEMVICYPNQNTGPIVIQKMGYQIINDFHAYQISVPCIPLLKISNKISFLKKGYNAYRNFVFSAHHIPYKIPYSFNQSEFPILLREDNLIAYKKAKGVFSLQIENTILWVKISNALFIGDFQCPNEAEFLRVIQKLKTLCFYAGIHAIHFQSSKGSNEESYFEKNYPSFKTFPFCFLDLGTSFPMEKCKSTFGDIDIF